jgi:hypothetical protein
MSAPHATAAQRAIRSRTRSVLREESEWIQAIVRDVERLVERHRLRRRPRTRSLVDEPPVAEADDPGLPRDISDPAQDLKRSCRPVGANRRRASARGRAGGREARRRLGRRRRWGLRAALLLTADVASTPSRAGDRVRHRAPKRTAVHIRPKRRERGDCDSDEHHESGPLDRRLSVLPCHPATVRLGGAPVGAGCDISVRGALQVAHDFGCSARGAIAQRGLALVGSSSVCKAPSAREAQRTGSSKAAGREAGPEGGRAGGRARRRRGGRPGAKGSVARAEPADDGAHIRHGGGAGGVRRRPAGADG